MLEQILEYERKLFFWLNGSEYELFDHFLWLVSDKLVWVPWIICLLFVLFYKKKWKEAILIVVSIVLVITIADQVASGVFKPFFMRFRPTHHPDFMEDVKILFNYKGGRYGFASSHASNAFGIATFTALLFRNRFFTVTICLFAILNAYSRIYLGVHFISDIVAGAIIGILAGIISYRLYLIARKYILKVSVSQLKFSICNERDVYILSWGFWGTLFVLLILNNQLIILLSR